MREGEKQSAGHSLEATLHTSADAGAIPAVSTPLAGRLFAVETPARGQRRLTHDLGEVLVQEDTGDQLLA